MSKFINGFNHGSNTCASTNAESVADEAFWEDSESLLEIMCTNAFSMPVLVCIKEEKGVYDFGNAFIAAQHTLQLIKYAYDHGNLLDSYLLLRRLFESVVQYLFFVALKQDQEDKASSGSGEKSLEDIVEAMGTMIETLEFDDSSAPDISFFHQWAVGKGLDEKAKKERRKVIQLDHYLKKLDALDLNIKICKEKYLEPELSNIQQIMNDFTHGNALYTMSHAFDMTKVAKSAFKKRLSYILSVLLVYTTLTKPQLLQSNDYIEALESERDPEPGSQYWIAPGIQHYFDAYVSKIHPELVKYLKEKNPVGMMIDLPEPKG